MTNKKYIIILTLTTLLEATPFYAMNKNKTEISKATQDCIDSINKCCQTIENTTKTVENTTKNIQAMIESREKQRQNSFHRYT